MPHGYRKERDSSRKVIYKKTHNNGDITKLIADKVNLPDEGEMWTPSVEDQGQTIGLGKFKTKKDAKQTMERWMKQNPKGAQFGIGGGLLPGMNDAKNSFDFWG